MGDRIIKAMQTTIDDAGRLIIPKEISIQARLSPGMLLDIRWRDGCIEIKPAPLSVEFVRKGRLLVAMPKQDIGLLTVECVEATRRGIEQERSGLTEAT
jgi:AbrB family looped-hinge helix DNA binding protein